MALKRPPAKHDDNHRVASRDGATNEDGALDKPLHRLPGFGTGLHRQRVAFVKAGETAKTTGSRPAGSLPGGAVSDLYLSIVMGGAVEKEAATGSADGRPQSAPPPQMASSQSPSPPVCDVCSLPLTTLSSTAAHHHETCLVHQVALDHSKPPSALDRGRFGLAIMAAQGWDPDSGRGLGRDQQGVPYPIEARARPDRQALGGPHDSSSRTNAGSLDSRRGRTPSTSAGSSPAPKSNRRFTGKQLRKMEEDRRRRHDRLREQILSNRDLDKYLRPQGDE